MVPGGLTSDQVARKAVATSPELRARQKATEGARAREDQATAEFWPKVSLSARYTRLSDIEPPMFPGGGSFPVFVDRYAIGGSLSVPVSDYLLRTARSARAAEHAVTASRMDAEAARRQVAANARLVYYDWIRAQGQLLVLEQRAETARVQVADTSRLFAEGVVSRADVLAAQSLLKSVELSIVRGRQALDVTTARLRVALHDQGKTTYQVGEDLLAPLPPAPGVENLQQLLDEARDKRPELAALRETEAATKDLAKLAGSARWPRLDLVANLAHANPNERIFPPRQKWDTTWDAGAVLSFSPTDLPGTGARVREQQARAEELAAQREALMDALRVEVEEAADAVTASAAAVDTAQQGLRAAEEGNRRRRELYQVGRATLLEVTEAEAELLRARLDVINAQIEARQARVRLSRAVGRDGVSR